MGGLYVIDYAIFNSTLLLSVFTVVDAYHNLSENNIYKAIRTQFNFWIYLETQSFCKNKSNNIRWCDHQQVWIMNYL